MGAPRLAASVRGFVNVRARYRCEYCLSPSEPTGILLTIDHIIPRSLGRQSIKTNLCSACERCNLRKGTRTRATDSETGREVRLFYPRQQKWEQHFQWSEDGTTVIGLTAGALSVRGRFCTNSFAPGPQRGLSRW